MTVKTDKPKPKRTVKKPSSKTKSKSDRDLAEVEKPKNTPNFYTLERILDENADYNIIVGERGNGKTYAVQEYLIRRFLQDGSQCMLLRRWMEDVKASNASQFWDGNLLARLGEMSDGRFTTVL